MTNKKFIVKKTKNRENVHGDFIAKMNPKCVPFYLRYNYVIVKNIYKDKNGNSEIFRIPVILQTDSEIKEDEIRLDMKVRVAIGAREGETVQIDFYDFFNLLKKNRIWTKFFGRQVNLLRTKYSSFTDMEIKLCRISNHVMKTIGINEGDKIFVESSNARISIKAFELPVAIIEDRKKKEQNENSVYGQLPEDKKRRELLAKGRESDLPWILLDFDARKTLGIDTNDPVRVYRNVQHAVSKKIHLVSIPLILTIIGFAISLESIKGNELLKIGMYIFGLLIVIFLNLLNVRLILK